MSSLRYALRNISEQLWVRPLAMSVASVFVAFAAHAADGTGLGEHVPSITPESIDSLLGTMSSSMLVIATFAVASMVAAYASASSTATPRAFSLVIADDVSQNALSTFIGAFIFSIVARVALSNEYFGPAGRFVLFVITIAGFAAVIVTFVRWVDRIARLGRVGATIDNVEDATLAAIDRYRQSPTLGGVPIGPPSPRSTPVMGLTIGFVQHIDVQTIEKHAAAHGLRVVVAVLPGDFVAPGQPVAHLSAVSDTVPDDVRASIASQFKIDRSRRFDDDPRFGVVVLSETASRALSPAVNDPGTALQVLGSLVRVFARWTAPLDRKDEPSCERVEVPTIPGAVMLRAAVAAISRDGAGLVEVAAEVQRVLNVVRTMGDPDLAAAARQLAQDALERALHALPLTADVEAVRRAMDGGR